MTYLVFFELIVISVLVCIYFYDIALINKKINLLFKFIEDLDNRSLEDFKYQRCAFIMINALYNNKMAKKEDIEYIENFIKEREGKFKDLELKDQEASK